MDHDRADTYLALLDAARPVRPDAAALADLQWRHLLAVPFENLDIHLGRPVELTEEALLAKILDRRRGGFCYELGGAFAALLRALDYRVTLLAARTYDDQGRPGIPFDHLALRVDLDRPWLVDVGFGRFAHHPIRLDLRTDQRDPGGEFRIVEGEYGELDVLHEGQPQYRLEPRPRDLRDFVAGCWWHQTSPTSHFTRAPLCSRPTPDGRITISDRTVVRTTGTDRHEEHLTDDAAVLAAYQDHFGITLPHPPTRPTPTGIPITTP
ncbi:arylamine N-acetyltransferase family protein [Embleya scabrispora]|uniref:arylamine N-acetyltransferase family protein n=1 Tax=Embleya scabrispora TaxID=159449 RepID=UPI00036D6A9B|nr:arylamine N-acetyltransferase [Embleya scabrispora]MYS83591.1 arylamine N-acetyltransferase [Streptomyces sp. SID5474]